MARYIVMLSLVMICSNASPCFAQSTDEDAKQIFEQATDQYNQSHFEEAAALFTRAYALRPSWKLWFNIGQAQAAAKRYGLALESFEKYLSEGGDDVADARSNAVISEMKRLRQLVGILEFQGAPHGATVHIDGVLRSEFPLSMPLRISAGIKHDVEIHNGDSIIHKQTLAVGSASTVVVRVEDSGATLSEIKPTAEETRPNTPTEKTAHDVNHVNAPKAVALTFGGLALATGVSAIVFWGVAGNKNDELNAFKDQVNTGALSPSDPTLQNKYDDVNTFDNLTTTMIIGTAVMATVSAVGVILWARNSKRQESTVSVNVNSIQVRF